MNVVQAQPSVLSCDTARSTGGVEIITNDLFEPCSEPTVRESKSDNLTIAVLDPPSTDTPSGVPAAVAAAAADNESTCILNSSVSHASRTFQELPSSALEAIIHERARSDKSAARAESAEARAQAAEARAELAEEELERKNEQCQAAEAAYAALLESKTDQDAVLHSKCNAARMECDAACKLANTLREENAALLKEYQDSKISITQTLLQLATVDKGLVGMLTENVASGLGATSADSPAGSGTSPHNSLSSYQGVICQLRNVVAAAEQRTQAESAAQSPIATGDVCDTLHVNPLFASASHAPCMHAMRDPAADVDSSESSLRWTPSRSVPLSHSPSPDGAAPAHTIDDSTCPHSTNNVSLYPTGSATTPMPHAFGNTAANPGLHATPLLSPSGRWVPGYVNSSYQPMRVAGVMNQVQRLAVARPPCTPAFASSLRTSDVRELESHPLLTTVLSPSTPRSHAAKTARSNVSVSLTPNASGRIAIEIQLPDTADDAKPTSMHQTECSRTPGARVEAASASVQEKTSATYMSASSSVAQPTPTSHCLPPYRGEPNVVSATPLISPPGYHSKCPTPSTGCSTHPEWYPGTVGPLASPLTFTTPPQHGDEIHAHRQQQEGVSLVTSSVVTPSVYGPGVLQSQTLIARYASALSSLLPTSACMAVQGSPMESSGSNSDSRGHVAPADKPLSAPRFSPNADTAEFELVSSSESSSSCADSDSSEDSDSESDVESVNSGVVYNVWGARLNEDEEMMVDEMIMAQRQEETAQQEEVEEALLDTQGMTASNVEQMLQERSQLFAAVAEKWGMESEVSKLLALSVAAERANPKGTFLFQTCLYFLLLSMLFYSHRHGVV